MRVIRRKKKDEVNVATIVFGIRAYQATFVHVDHSGRGFQNVFLHPFFGGDDGPGFLLSIEDARARNSVNE